MAASSSTYEYKDKNKDKVTLAPVYPVYVEPPTQLYHGKIGDKAEPKLLDAILEPYEKWSEQVLTPEANFGGPLPAKAHLISTDKLSEILHLQSAYLSHGAIRIRENGKERPFATLKNELPPISFVWTGVFDYGPKLDRFENESYLVRHWHLSVVATTDSHYYFNITRFILNLPTEKELESYDITPEYKQHIALATHSLEQVYLPFSPIPIVLLHPTESIKSSSKMSHHLESESKAMLPSEEPDEIILGFQKLNAKELGISPCFIDKRTFMPLYHQVSAKIITWHITRSEHPIYQAVLTKALSDSVLKQLNEGKEIPFTYEEKTEVVLIPNSEKEEIQKQYQLWPGRPHFFCKGKNLSVHDPLRDLFLKFDAQIELVFRYPTGFYMVDIAVSRLCKLAGDEKSKLDIFDKERFIYVRLTQESIKQGKMMGKQFMIVNPNYRTFMDCWINEENKPQLYRDIRTLDLLNLERLRNEVELAMQSQIKTLPKENRSTAQGAVIGGGGMLLTLFALKTVAPEAAIASDILQKTAFSAVGGGIIARSYTEEKITKSLHPYKTLLQEIQTTMSILESEASHLSELKKTWYGSVLRKRR